MWDTCYEWIQRLKIFGGTWRRVHHRIWLIFATLDKLASDLFVGGVLFVDQCLDGVDLERGGSGGVWEICRKCNSSGRTWRRVYGQNGLRFVLLDRSRDGLLIYVTSFLKIWELWYGAFGWDFWVEETNRAFGWDFLVEEMNRNDGIIRCGSKKKKKKRRIEWLVWVLGLWYDVENLNVIPI